MVGVERKPIRIYLDQADWSYLQRGRFSDVESSLRSLAEQKRIAIYISDEHLTESAGRKRRLELHLDYIRSFPNTYLITTSVEELLTQSVEEMRRSVVDENYRPSWSMKTLSLQEVTPAELLRRSRELGAQRGVWKVRAGLKRRSREARGKPTKVEIVRDERFIAAMLRGDRETSRKFLQSAQDESLSWWQNAVITAMGCFGTVMRRFVYAAPLDKSFGPIFQLGVVSQLKPVLWRDEEQMRSIYRKYKDDRAFARVALPLACRCALIREIHYNSQYKYQPSDEIDQRHAVFAFLVDLFTCDKRNVSPLQKTMRTGGFDIAIMIVEQLNKTLKEIQKRLEKPIAE